MNRRPSRTGEAGGLRARFWLEVVLAAIAAILFVVTLFWHDWIEAFGIEPDGGNGSLEWVVVGFFGLAALVCGALAERERRWQRGRLGHEA